ncbi:MAG: dihydroorotase family protein [archaeon]
MTIDLILENCRIYNTTHMLDGDIAIDDGKIVEVARSHKKIKAAERIDIDGRIVIPGVIDPHVHFRDPGYTHKGDFETESLAALYGGVTTVFDMPNNEPRADSEENLEFKRSAIEGKSYVDYALYCEITDDNCRELPNAFAYKAHLDSGRCSYRSLQKALKYLQNKVVCVHPEYYKTINTKVYNEKKPETHSLVRAVSGESTTIKKTLGLDLGTNHLHFCHVTTGAGLGLITNSNKNISCEATPHHLLLDIMSYGTWGPYAKVNPPLRSPENRMQLWAGLSYINMLGSDHAPHLREEKEQKIMQAAPGFPGVETMLPLMVNEVNNERLTWQDLVRLTSHGPAQVFGLKHKGEIVSGKDADITVIDNAIFQNIDSNNLHSKCGWTIYEGEEIQGVVEKVFLRGELVLDDGKVLGKRGQGVEIGF